MKDIVFRKQQKEVLDLMGQNNKLRIIAPTSAGKSFMIFGDIYNKIQNQEESLNIIVSSRILLLQQLSLEFSSLVEGVNIVHMHSGDTGQRKITDYLEFAYWVEVSKGHKVVFVTYNSLHKIIKSEVQIDGVYLDEAHNAVKRHFFEYVRLISDQTKSLYTLTATPKYHPDPTKNGNNNTEVYGENVYIVNAVDLINEGSILPPKATPMNIPFIRDKEERAYERDYFTLMDTLLNESNMDRVLITCPSTKAMMELMSMTDFIKDLNDNGYDIFHITAKYGAFHNNKKVKRGDFLTTIEQYGKEQRKFVVLHYSILTEGWSNNSIQSSILMRDQSMGATVQNIGRNLRLAHNDIKRINNGELLPGDYPNYEKPYGNIVIPVYQNTGAKTEETVNSVITEVFVNGNYVFDSIPVKKEKKKDNTKSVTV
jgi:superfamily II DNA or RNA helicase